MKPIFKRFNDLTARDISINLHVHTSQTDGASTPQELIKKAVELKLEAIAFTEHVRKSSDWFDGFASQINALKDNKNIKIFLGIEARALDIDGTIDATSGMIAKSDMVIGVVHRFPKGMEGLSQAQVADKELELAMGLLKNEKIDVLGHPFGMYIKLFSKLPVSHLEQLLIEAEKQGKAVEINTKYLPDMPMFFALLRKVNPRVSLGSDAHHEDELIRSYDLIKKQVS